MPTIHRFQRVVLLLAISCCIVRGSVLRSDDTPRRRPVVVRVGYLPATHDALLFVAQEMNLFDKTRITVQPKPYDNSVQILNDLKSGLLDIGIPGIATPATDIGGRAPLSIIGGAAAKSAALVALPRLADRILKASPLQAKLELLDRKRIGAVRGSTGLAIFRQALAKARLDESQVDIREYSKPPDIISGLLADDLDAGLLWSPHMTLAEARGLKIALWMSDVLPNHVCCRQVARDEFLVQEGAVVEYLVGILKADKLMREARASSASRVPIHAALRRYFPTLTDNQIDLELFNRDARTTVSPDLDREGIHAYLSAMSAAGLMKADECASVEGKVVSRFLEKAYERLGCSPSVAAGCVNKSSADCECLR